MVIVKSRHIEYEILAGGEGNKTFVFEVKISGPVDT